MLWRRAERKARSDSACTGDVTTQEAAGAQAADDPEEIVLPDSAAELRQLAAEARYYGLPELEALAQAQIARVDARSARIAQIDAHDAVIQQLQALGILV